MTSSSTVLITGAAAGIGRETALAFARRGATVGAYDLDEAGLATLRGEVEHLFDQKRITEFETPTKDYTIINASVSLSPFGRDSKTTLLLSANNILDVNVRRHASFLKDFAPLAGRDLRATLRFGL